MLVVHLLIDAVDLRLDLCGVCDYTESWLDVGARNQVHETWVDLQASVPHFQAVVDIALMNDAGAITKVRQYSSMDVVPLTCCAKLARRSRWSEGTAASYEVRQEDPRLARSSRSPS